MTILEFKKKFITLLMDKYDCRVNQTWSDHQDWYDKELTDILYVECIYGGISIHIPHETIKNSGMTIDIEIDNSCMCDVYMALLDLGLYKSVIRSMHIGYLRYDTDTLYNIIDEILFGNDYELLAKTLEFDFIKTANDMKIKDSGALLIKFSRFLEIDEDMITTWINKYNTQIECIAILLDYKRKHFGFNKEEIRL